MKKIVGRIDLLGTRTAVILAPQIPYITNLLQTALALIAITSAQGRPAVSTGAVPAWIRNVAIPAPNSEEPLTTSATT